MGARPRRPGRARGVPAGLLSHGDKRKLELAMLLAGRPRVLLLDEPMAGVSMEDVPELVELIRSVHADEGRTVLMVEHHMEVVTGLAQRIAVMHHGRLLAVDTPEAIMRERDRAAGVPRRSISDAAAVRCATCTSTSASRTCCKGVTFDVPEGGVTALLGRNGVGKTTTLRALMGLVERARHDRVRRRRHQADADAQDRPARRRLRPRGPRRLRGADGRREPAARRTRR